jgi:hypothetical protein
MAQWRADGGDNSRPRYGADAMGEITLDPAIVRSCAVDRGEVALDPTTVQWYADGGDNSRPRHGANALGEITLDPAMV